MELFLREVLLESECWGRVGCWGREFAAEGEDEGAEMSVGIRAEEVTVLS